MSKKLVLIMSLIVVFLPGFLHAGWVEDWIDQKTVTDPGSFEGQKRGYMTAGSFSARWQMSNDHLFTIEKPRLKFGCGGIDIFMGSFSYLNPEYLVKKFQRILQAAPAAAFDLALNVMCEPCSKTMKSLTGIVDTLNNLQINDCKAAYALSAAALSQIPLKDNPKAQATLRATATKDFGLHSGLKDLAGKFNEKSAATDGAPQVSEPEMTKDCPAKFTEIFTAPSILQSLMEAKGHPPSHIELVRGLVGDVAVREINEDGKISYKGVSIPRCEKNDPKRIVDFITGKTEVQNVNFNCFLSAGPKTNLKGWVSTTLTTLHQKMIVKTSLLSDDEKKLIAHSPLPVMTALKHAAKGQISTVVVGQASEITARAYAYNIMADLYHEIINALLIVDRLKPIERKACQTELFAGRIALLKELQVRVSDYASDIFADYSATAQNQNAIMEIALKYAQFEKMAEKELSRAYGKSQANRMLGN